MKKNSFSILPLLIVPLLLHSQIRNQGAWIVLEEGVVLTADLDLINETTGTWRNDGSLRTTKSLYNRAESLLTGDGLYQVGESWWNEGIFLPGASRIRFSGTAPGLCYNATEDVYELELAKTGGGPVQLASRLSLAGNLVFSRPENYLALGDFDLQLGGQTAILGYNAQNYLVTNGAGYIALPVNPSLTVPVGYDTQTYNPIAISGTAAALQVRCLEHALLDGHTGAVMSHAVDAAWDLFSPTDDIVDFDLTVFWRAGDETMDFDRTRSGIARYTPDGWYLPAGRLGPADVNGLFARSWAGSTDWGLFAVADIAWVGQEEVLPAYGLHVFPIPAREGVWVEMEQGLSGRLRLIDQQGNTLLQSAWSGQKCYLPLPAGLSSGVYYLQVIDEQGRWGRRKIIVQH